MESRFFTVSSKKNPLIKIDVAEGHFATGSAHISHYIDISDLKSGASRARGAARELAAPYLKNCDVDAIVCMEGTEIIAAYLAEEILTKSAGAAKPDKDIYVLTPMHSSNGNFIFHQNVQKRIFKKNIVILVASMSTGSTVNRALECINYYGGKLTGISAIFSAFSEIGGREVYSLFTEDDIDEYRFYSPSECEMCHEGLKLDAIINSEGYTKIY